MTYKAVVEINDDSSGLGREVIIARLKAGLEYAVYRWNICMTAVELTEVSSDATPTA